ncbi:glutathione S-transferase like protein [Roridomyces roridus]|uniref:glutathione transferase n=1 Tax=Roridomyces roridus TaxID=1738132 RepID=A0AAD7CGN5_9AGAR|nr:glutathione S-transferase like protein [Roridomyces roridus]
MLIVHHLQRSQSERVVWLCEELGIPYELKVYRRERATLLAPPEFKALHPAGTAPIVQDGTIILSESSAIIEYITQKYAQDSRLKLSASDPGFANYIYWYYYAIGSLQSSLDTPMFLRASGADAANPIVQFLDHRMERGLKFVDERLKETNAYLAGGELTLADIYMVFQMTTLRLFSPFALTAYPGILAWVRRVAERPAYKRFIEKAEQGEDRGIRRRWRRRPRRFVQARRIAAPSNSACSDCRK